MWIKCENVTALSKINLDLENRMKKISHNITNSATNTLKIMMET